MYVCTFVCVSVYVFVRVCTIGAVTAVQAMQVGSKTLLFKGAGGRAATDTVSMDKTLLTAVICTRTHAHTHEDLAIGARHGGARVPCVASYCRRGSCLSTL